jgi:serine/threonine protein kinase/tetratricopeptide (TPR) repeat protein
MMSAADAAEILLTDAVKRFVLRRRIGEGAFGVVWEAYDRERGARVALKSLMHTDANALLLFKKEFRALADMVHPNLVTLYELLTFGEQWFFTMELVDGIDFLKFVTSPLLTHVPVISNVPGAIPPPEERTASTPVLIPPDDDKTLGLPKNGGGFEWYNEPTLLDPSSSGNAQSDPTMKVRFTPVPFATAGALHFDAERLRAALRQLAAGLMTLHEAGKLHRDIKPSNVLVTREGRVVILDFGLVTELSAPGAAHSRRPIVGTPIFMSPEQGLGESLTPASDWYSVGVMLYTALTGRVPFDGPPMHVLMSKAEVDAVPPGVIVQGLPPDLESLCTELLRRNPAERPTGEDILSRLGVESSRTISMTEATPSMARGSVFVGREKHLGVLSQAFATVKNKRPAAALVYGGSGMGKSSLIRRFLQQTQERHGDAVILRGRCYQRESVPYKALDSLVDELSVYLQDLPMTEATALMPRGADALMRLFPVLRQVEVPMRQAQAAPIVNPHELRRRAFGALRDLLARIAERHPLILTIDDLQWGDADSDALLSEIVRPPDPPALLLIATYRSDEVRSAPLMKALRPAIGAPVFEVHELPVGEFTPAEAQKLAVALLGPKAPGRAEAIAREAEGNPLFIDALARHAQLELEGAMRRSTPPSGLRGGALGAPAFDAAPPIEPNVKLGEMIQARVARLPTGARRLLETMVVAGKPLDVTLARRAAGAESHEPAVLSLLMVMHLVRPRVDSPGDEVEIYHDRIRESVLATIPPEDQRAYHDRLAVTLELDGRTDPELLCTHYHAAGRTTKALHYALKAADEAFDALAFDRAARLYRLALSLGPPRDVPILTRLGESLANAGRGAEAADAYLEAAEKSPPNGAIDLRRRAAEQLLISGHVERGLSIVRLVLEPLGMKLAETSRGAIFALLARRAHLRVRGLKFKERREEEIPPEELIKVDMCWAIAAGLSLVDAIRGADFQARHLLLALQSGEPYRIARALSGEVVFSASAGIKNQARTEELLKTTETLAQRIKRPHALALATTMAGAAKYLAGSWLEGLMLLERGAAMLREQCTGVTWELDTADVFALSALYRLGRWGDLAKRVHEVLRGAHERGDRYVAVQCRNDGAWCAELAADQPEEAKKRLAEALELAPRSEGPLMQQALQLWGIVHVDLYIGDAEAAWSHISGGWADLKKTFMLEIPMFLMDMLDLRARSAIACASQEGVSEEQRRDWLKAAERDIARIEKEKVPWATALAALIRAGAATVRGSMAEARALVVAAETALDAAQMGLHKAVARRRYGQIVGGEQGRAAVAEADSAMAALGIRAPAKIAAMCAPGKYPS